MTTGLNEDAFCTIDRLPRLAGCTLAIGNFDGVHPGHRALLARAKEKGAPVAVLSFEPHPRAFFAKEKGAAPEPFRLTAPAAKTRLLQEAGADHVVLLRFDAALAALSPEDFIDRVIVAGLGAAHVVVGADFAFGRSRAGNAATLAAAGAARGFTVEALSPLTDAAGRAYSSSRAREMLRAGDLEGAAQVLGRPWQIEGPIVHGDKRGRGLGFPTANQPLGDLLRLPFGIYAVQAQVDGEAPVYGGVASLGMRPMFAVAAPLLETFLFGFSREIYGNILRVTPLKYLREEAKFEGLAALCDQIKQDCLDARAVLKSHSL